MVAKCPLQSLLSSFFFEGNEVSYYVRGKQVNCDFLEPKFTSPAHLQLLLHTFDDAKLCAGCVDENLLTVAVMTAAGTRKGNCWRSKSCSLITNTTICKGCILLTKLLRESLKRKDRAKSRKKETSEKLKLTIRKLNRRDVEIEVY